MPSPVVHLSAALGLWLAADLRGWRSLLAVGVASIAPDFDLVYRLLGPEYMRLHHGATHSLVGATLLGVTTARLALRGGAEGGRRLLVACVLAGLSHLPFDYSTGAPGAPISYGIEVFWPWTSQRYLDPNPFFGAFGLDKQGFLLNMLTPESLPLYGREAGVGALLIATGAAIRASTRRTRSQAP